MNYTRGGGRQVYYIRGVSTLDENIIPIRRHIQYTVLIVLLIILKTFLFSKIVGICIKNKNANIRQPACRRICREIEIAYNK